MAYIFLDTETTGTDEQDRIIQLAFIYVDTKGNKRVVDEYYKPPVPINFEAMAVHNITEEMVANKPLISDKDSAFIKLGEDKVNNDSNILIAHNAPFDIGMMTRDGFDNKMRVIDTLRCSKHLLKDAKRHKLGVLYYQYGLYRQIDELAVTFGIDLQGLEAHNAVYDNLMLSLLFKLLVQKAGSVEKLIELTKTPVLIETFSFGKHKGELVKDVAKSDMGYLNWMLKNMSELDEDMVYTIEFYKN